MKALQLAYPLLLPLFKLVCLEPTQAHLLHVVVEVVVWKHVGRVAGNLEAATGAHYRVDGKI